MIASTTDIWVAVNFNVILFFITHSKCAHNCHFFNEQRIIPIIRLSSIQFLMMGFSAIPYSFLARLDGFKKLSLIDLISTMP